MYKVIIQFYKVLKNSRISLALDGSENHRLIKDKPPEYTMPMETMYVEYQLFSDEEDEVEESNETDSERP